MIYAIEAWVLAVVGWAWITLRDLIPNRPLAEELAVYSTLTVSTISLGLCSVTRDRAEVFKAYLGFTLVVWTYLAYALFDGIGVWSTGSRYVPDSTVAVCCPNRDVPDMNRALYFGRLGLFLVPGAITFALQTVQVFVAGGAYVAVRESVWPGNGWGYSIAALLAVVYFARFSGLLETPCPGGAFQSLFGSTLNDGTVFCAFAFALVILILLDGLSLPHGLAVASRLFGLGIVTLFCASVYYASDGRGMLTLPLLLLLIKAWLPVVWGIVEPWWLLGDPVPTAPPAPPARKQTVRWVMPVDVPTPGRLPAPLVMTEAPPEPAEVSAHKKRF